MTEADKERLKKMIKRGRVYVKFTSRFRDIFVNDDMRMLLEYQDPELEDGEVNAEMTQEILEGVAQQTRMNLEDLVQQH